MQIFHHDLATKMKRKNVDLGKDLKKGLPLSIMKNESDYRLFDNFVRCEFEIEMVRAIKFQELTALAKQQIIDVSEDDLMDQTREKFKDLLRKDVPTFIVDHILNSKKASEKNITEESIYNGILHMLETNAKWTEQDTDEYIDISVEYWPQ